MATFAKIFKKLNSIPGISVRQSVEYIGGHLVTTNGHHYTFKVFDQFCFFNCDIIINTGVGGGLNPVLKTLDMVISSGAAQHDFDLTVFNYQKGQVPGFPRIIPADSEITGKALAAARETGAAYGFAAYTGVVVSGDQFIAGKEGRKNIDDNFPEAWITEMEGAAIAQVAAEFQKPFLIIRSVSDKANGEADMTFNEMLPLAARNSQEVLLRILEKGL